MKRVYRRVLCAAALSLAALSPGCERASEVKAAAPPSDALPVVAVVSPSLETLSRAVELTGEFRPWQQVDLHAKVAGYLASITVDAGSPVRAGQLIGTIQAPELESEMLEAQSAAQRHTAEEAIARAQIERAKAQIGVAKAGHDRLLAVNRKEPGLVAAQEVDEALARLRTAEADHNAAVAMLGAARQSVASAQARMQRIATMMEYRKITAPFAGVVTKRFADPGSMIQTGVASQTQALPLVRIADISRLRLAVVIPEHVVSQMRVGSPVEVRIPATGKSLSSRVARINSTVAANSRSMEAEVDVPNPSGEIVPGMVADIALAAATTAQRLSLPLQAVSRRGGLATVLIVKADGAVEERRLDTGVESDTHVEVRSGVSVEDRIIVGNRALLRPGTKVQVKAN